MKFKQPDIESEIYPIDDSGFINCTTDSHWHPENDIFFKVYEDLISEWAKNLYVPYELLKDIIAKTYDAHGAFLLRYSLKSILDISTVDWKHYEKFKNATNHFNKDRFNFFVLYYKNPWSLVEDKLKSLKFNEKTIEMIKRRLNLKAFCLANNGDPEAGCLIVLNGELVDHHDANVLEQELDHEMNHYFKQFENDEPEVETLSLQKRIEKIGNDAGYDLSNPFVRKDFIDHVLDRSEFIPMIANVCNILTFRLNDSVDKYEWLIDHSTSSFLKSDEYRSLHSDLQNVLLFSTICRAYSSKRWNMLKENLKIQFDKKETFTEKMKCKLMTFIERMKRII